MINLYLAVSVVFPLFCMMALGYFLKAIGIFNGLFLKQLNGLCFRVFLPLVLFINIYQSDFFELFSAKLILFAVILVVVSFISLMIIIPKIEQENNNRGVMIQGIFRSNYILFGVPIAQTLYGNENTGTTAILIAFIIPLFNLLSVVALSIYSKQKQSRKHVFTEVIHNPLIIGSVVAFFFVLTNIRLPIIIEHTVTDISKVATPLALIVLGGSFQFKSIGEYKKQLSISVLGKIIILPGIFIPIAILFGFKKIELAALMALFASPTAVSTFTMAQNAKANYKLSGQIVVFDSILSVASIFLWIVVLKYFNLI